MDCTLADPTWADYEADGDRAALAAKRARLFRANYAPSLARALKHAGNGASHAFADRLEKGLERRLLNDAAPVSHSSKPWWW